MASIEEQVALLAGSDTWHTPASLDVPAIRMTDGPAGARGTSWTGPRSAVFPCGSALGATFDPALIREVGVALGREARSKSAQVLLAPTVNLHRTPIGGRNFECMSEDPVLTANIAEAYVRGVQSEGVACCIKHFVGNDTEFQRMTISSDIDERTLRENYLVPFEVAVRAGVYSVMTGYNRLNGVFCADHEWLLRTVLRGEWGFDGVVVSDWFGLHSTVEAIVAGVDIEMPGPTRHRGQLLVDAVKGGRVAEQLVSEAVDRVRLLAQRTSASESDGSESSLGTDDIREIQHRAAVASMVLLKNDSATLPWAKDDVADIALIGPYASQGRPQGGGSAKVLPNWVAPVGESLQGRGLKVEWAQGCSIERFHTPVRGEFDVEITDVDGNIEHRMFRSSSAFWQQAPVDGLSLTFGAVMRGTFTPTESGLWTIGCRSIGECHMFIDGVEVLAIDAGDVGGSMFDYGSPERFGSVELVADEPVDIELRYPIAPHPGIRGFTFGLRPPETRDLIAEAVDRAATADRVVLVVGTDDDWETESEDRSTITLPGRQDELISAVAEVNSNVVVVVNAGSPVAMPWLDEVQAVLHIWFPGGALGTALADVLLGDCDPGGRLPVTFPRTLDRTPAAAWYPGLDGVMQYGERRLIGHRWWRAVDEVPLFWFGHGLSYSSFEATVKNVVGSPTDGVVVHLNICNTGDRYGTHVVHSFTSYDGDHPDMDDEFRYAGSVKVCLEGGESIDVEIELDPRRFQSWLADEWSTPRGDYCVHIGRSAGDTEVVARLTV